MFRKLISNLPFSPSLINQLGFYSKRLKKEQFTRRIGLLFTVLTIIVQTLAIIAPAQATLASSANDIIYGGGNLTTIQGVLQKGCDSRNRCDIKAIYGAYGITMANLANAKSVKIYSSTQNNYWSIGRAPRDSGDVKHQIPGGPVIYARTLAGWGRNRNWDALQVQTGQGLRWILTECGNVVTQENQPTPKVPDLQVTKKTDNTSPLKGQFFNYTITLTNIGKGTAQNVVLKDDAPTGVKFVSTGPSDPVTNPQSWKTSKLFNMAPGQSYKYNIRAQLTADGPARFDNTACALDTNGDANPNNNCGSATILVQPVCPTPGKQDLPIDDKDCTNPALKIEKTADKTDLKVGDSFIYTIKVTNKGDVNLPSVVVRDIAPNEIEFNQAQDVGAKTFTPVSNKRDYTSKVFALKKGASVSIFIKSTVIKSNARPVVNQACALSTGSVTTAGACDDKTVTIKEVCSTNPALPKDSKECQPPCTVAGKANLPQNSPDCKPCNETVASTDDKDASCLELHKKARNITQQISDANGTTAKPGDTIEYTLSVTNRGKETRKGFVVEENIEDIMDYADLIDASGAVFTENPVRMLTWSAVDIKPNETINRTILIRVKSSIPNTPASTSDPLSNDLKMTNIYGDAVEISLPNTPVKVAEQTVTNLPSTGLGTNILIGTILLMGATYFYFRSRLMVKEVALVRQQFNSGAGV